MKRDAAAGVNAGVSRPGPVQQSVWERLKAACAEDWACYLRNDFIWHLAEGNLAPSAYRHFIEQDYLYCLNYCRAYALAAFKSTSAGELRRSLSRAAAVIEGEVELHRRRLGEWGVSDDALDTLPESTANIAYTRYLLDLGMSGDLLDLHVALSVCVIGYAEVGTLLIGHERTKLAGNPYRSWIEQYADPDFQSLAKSVSDHLDRLAEGHLTERRFTDLSRIFRQTLRLDIAFWDMAFRELV